MIDASTTPSMLVTLGLIPLLWSGAIALARGVGNRSDVAPVDRREKQALALMLAPVAFGVVAIIASRLAPETAVRALPLLDLVDLAFVTTPVATAAAPGAPSADWLPSTVSVLIAVYLLGTGVAALRLGRASLRLRRVLASAAPAAGNRGDLLIAETDLPPFATTGGRIILPASLVSCAPQPHLDLIIAHERAHIRRGDARYYLALAWIDAVFWFNPFVRAQTQRCRLAAELSCDQIVVGAAPEMRRTYAQAIVSALKHAAGNALPCAPAAFSTRKHGEYRMRIASIMQGPGAPRKERIAVAIAALAAATALAGAQFAYAFEGPAPDNAVAFSSPMLDGKLTSQYGNRKDPFTEEVRFHQGVDIAAPDGTPITAPANGTVTRVGATPGYGNLVEIDHGGGFVTRYGQLKSASVAVGDEVTAGQRIALVGSSGRATGPHLHVEVYLNGETVDPASHLILPERTGPSAMPANPSGPRSPQFERP